MKKTVAILGATGMLGSALYAVLKDKYRLILSVRDLSKIKLLEQKYGGASDCQLLEFDASKIYQEFLDKKGGGEYTSQFFDSLRNASYIINAIGVTIPFSLKDPVMTLFVNGGFPRILASHFGEKLIHVTTDCVYNGKEGFPYDENSPKSPVDLYGLSKSLGEPVSCLTLRTSIIGRELEDFTGLLEWFLQQSGKTIKGFTNHFWNGLTTWEFAKACDTIMSRPHAFPKNGVFHVFSTPISKYEMLLKFRERYGVDCEIKPDRGEIVNRTLTTVYDVNACLNIPPFDTMLAELN